MRERNDDNDFLVQNSGLIVNPQIPFLGASPDGKVIDPGFIFPHGLLEIKCVFRDSHKTIQEKCADTSFYLKKEGDDFQMNHETSEQGKKYYAQIQMQLALIGLPWCDFCVFMSGSKEMAVVRVYFDKKQWDENIGHLGKFYLDYVIPYILRHRNELVA